MQDTDRPGSDIVGHVWDDWYGNDTHYKNDATYSNGTSKKVTVDINNTIPKKGKFPKATFTFKGTGFDVISVTSGATGRVNMTVSQKSGDKWVQIGSKYSLDTYYGYKMENGEWVVDEKANETNALYQIPIIKVEDLEYGEYKVELVPTFVPGLNTGNKNQYDFYLDAIRIYDPANPANEDYHVIEDVYKQDGENNPRFTELRDILLNAHNMGAAPTTGTVFVDGNGELNEIDAYESYGPKNEV